MKIKSSCNLYSYNQISDVSSQAGLYAWYMKMQVGKANINSPENMAKALCKLAQTVCYPNLEMHVQGHLNLQLKGDLSHIWYGHGDNEHSSTLKDVINNPEGRSILGEIFDLAVPLMSSPLYIGVSKNLKARLQTHARLIEAYKKDSTRKKSDLDNTLPVDDAESLDSDKSFAQRIADRGIDSNRLIVGVMLIEQNKRSPELIRRTVEAAETILNRIFYPILGRR
jgi:hypothetical protein